jgi:cytoskeletal protein CcmA (bactofilin family)
VIFIGGLAMMNKTLSFSWVRMCAMVCLVGGFYAIGAISPSQAQSQTSADSTASPTRSAAVAMLNGRNVYSAGASVRPSTTVEGDYVAAGGSVVIDQPVKGDATIAGGSISVRAPVGDDVRAAGGDVAIESTINGELFAAAGNITLSKVARVATAATLYAGNVIIDGKIDGPLKVGAQKVIINGEVNGDVRLDAEKVELGPTARIVGALQYPISAELKKADGATVSGAITREVPEVAAPDNSAKREWHMGKQSTGPLWAGTVFTFIALLACAAVLLLVFPEFSDHASNTVQNSPGKAVALGFGSLLLVPMLAGMLFITILGIPLGVALLMLYPALLLVGYLVGVLYIARRGELAIRKDTDSSFSVTISFFALALLLMMLISRLPFAGPLALIIITVIGAGACILELNRRRNKGSGTTPLESKPENLPSANVV